MNLRSVSQLLPLLGINSTTETEIFQQLAEQILQDDRRARAFGVTAENAEVVVRHRLKVLNTTYPKVREFCQGTFQQESDWLKTLWDLWIPLALHLIHHQQVLQRPLIQGILGGQGTGKTTLAAILTRMLQSLGYRSLSLSLDDLYKTHADRVQLRQQDPRLLWRGPPGTHEIELGIQVLDQLRQPQSHAAIALPRFDKSLHQGSGDRVTPESVTGVDIVLFEGWCVGVRPIDPRCFEVAPAPIVTDADRAFACEMNHRLQAYVPLWNRLDSLIVLHPVDYRLSQQWRKQAEQQLRASGKSGMSDGEIDQFVEYFWKALHPELFIPPLIAHAELVDLVIEIQADHTSGSVYKPGNL